MSIIRTLHDIYGLHRDLVVTTQRHPYMQDDDIAAQCQAWTYDRWRHPSIDVTAARVHLGASFPELASHGDRCRIFYCLAWMKGLYGTTEEPCGRGRCDVMVGTLPALNPLVIIEVKSTATAPAADQVARYRDHHPGVIAVVTAPSFPPALVKRAVDLDVRLLTGQQTVHLLEDLAVWNLWHEPRRLSVEAAA